MTSLQSDMPGEDLGHLLPSLRPPEEQRDAGPLVLYQNPEVRTGSCNPVVGIICRNS